MGVNVNHHPRIRLSSHDILPSTIVGPSGGSQQLLMESTPHSGHFMHHDWPLPSDRGQFASVMGGGGTLGRAGNRHQLFQAYPPHPPMQLGPSSTFRQRGGAGNIYHTCERPMSNNKKRDTIVEDNNTESSV